jgi:hypothetical protein
VFVHVSSRSLVVTDLAFNADPDDRTVPHASGLMRLYPRLVAAGRRCCVSRPFGWRRAFLSNLDAMDRVLE